MAVVDSSIATHHFQAVPHVQLCDFSSLNHQQDLQKLQQSIGNPLPFFNDKAIHRKIRIAKHQRLFKWLNRRRDNSSDTRSNSSSIGSPESRASFESKPERKLVPIPPLPELADLERVLAETQGWIQVTDRASRDRNSQYQSSKSSWAQKPVEKSTDPKLCSVKKQQASEPKIPANNEYIELLEGTGPLGKQPLNGRLSPDPPIPRREQYELAEVSAVECYSPTSSSESSKSSLAAKRSKVAISKGPVTHIVQTGSLRNGKCLDSSTKPVENENLKYSGEAAAVSREVTHPPKDSSMDLVNIDNKATKSKKQTIDSPSNHSFVSKVNQDRVPAGRTVPSINTITEPRLFSLPQTEVLSSRLLTVSIVDHGSEVVLTPKINDEPLLRQHGYQAFPVMDDNYRFSVPECTGILARRIKRLKTDISDRRITLPMRARVPLQTIQSFAFPQLSHPQMPIPGKGWQGRIISADMSSDSDILSLRDSFSSSDTSLSSFTGLRSSWSTDSQSLEEEEEAILDTVMQKLDHCILPRILHKYHEITKSKHIARIHSFLYHASPIIHACGTGGRQDSSDHQGWYSASTANSTTASTPSQSTGKKRKSRDFDDEEEQGNGEGRSFDGKSHRSSTSTIKKLACPFHKADARKFQTTAQSKKYKTCPRGLVSTKDLLDHLKGVHCGPRYWCKRCSAEFKTPQEEEQHAKRSTPCDLYDNPEFLQEGYIMTTERKRALKKKSVKVTVEQHWYGIWSILFPDLPPPDSVYQALSDHQASYDQAIEEVMPFFLESLREDMPSLQFEAEDVNRLSQRLAQAVRERAWDLIEKNSRASLASTESTSSTVRSQQSLDEKNVPSRELTICYAETDTAHSTGIAYSEMHLWEQDIGGHFDHDYSPDDTMKTIPPLEATYRHLNGSTHPQQVSPVMSRFAGKDRMYEQLLDPLYQAGMLPDGVHENFPNEEFVQPSTDINDIRWSQEMTW